MELIKRAVRSLIRDEEAIAASEYALMLGLIALLLFVVIRIFGSNLRNYWTNVNTSVFSQ
jgi:Flp pilus assembly pilin Flp